MKTREKSTPFFTSQKLLYIFTVAGIFSIASCTKKDDSSQQSTAVTQDDATEVVTQAVVNNGGGLSLQVQGTAMVSSNATYLSLCGLQKDSTVSGSGSIGSNISWSYNFGWHWMLTCNSGTPSQFDFTFNGGLTYEGPLMKSQDTSIATYAVTGLGGSSTQWTINTSLTRAGVKQSKVGQQATFYAQVTITGSNLVVSKSTQKIVSGTATWQITGYDSFGKNVSYSGTLTFLGNNTGTITFANGHTVNISWL